MGTYILKLAVLANSFLLAIPPGTCFMLPRVIAKGQAVEKQSCCCCQQEAPPPEEKQAPVPIQPFRCCCQADSTLPPVPVSPPMELISCDLAPIADGQNSVSVFDHSMNVEAFPSPPLRLLNCVWRC